MPQNQPSGRGLLPSPTAWSPDQHHVSWRLSVYIGQDWRAWSGVWPACPHSHREVSEMPVVFRWALRPQCPVRSRKIVVCWARSSLQNGSRFALYPPFSFFQSPLHREWRSVLASLWVTGFCVCGAWLENNKMGNWQQLLAGADKNHFNCSCPTPHHTTQAVWVWGERQARLTVLRLNTFWRKSSSAFHPLYAIRNACQNKI